MPLKDWDVTINYGIKTGFNDAFIITEEKRSEILGNCKTADERKRTDELIRPILRGRDIKRYSYEWACIYLIATYNGSPEKDIIKIDITKYPAVKKHLDAYWKQIEQRADQGDTPYHLRSCAYMDDFSKPKIMWAETMRIRKENIERFPRFSYTTKSFFTDKTCFIAVGEDLKYLLAFLNSTIGRYQLSQTVSMMDNGGYLMQKIYVEQIKICKLDKLQSAKLIILVDSLLENNTGVTDETIENQIDDIVFKAFGVNEEEQAYLKTILSKPLNGR